MNIGSAPARWVHVGSKLARRHNPQYWAADTALDGRAGAIAAATMWIPV